MAKKTKSQLIKERDLLISFFERNGVDVIISRGDFHSGACKLNGEEILVVNSRLTIQQQIMILATRLKKMGTESFYMRPVHRDMIERYALI